MLLLNKRLKSEVQEIERDGAKSMQKYLVETEQKRLIIQNIEEKLELAEASVNECIILDWAAT